MARNREARVFRPKHRLSEVLQLPVPGLPGPISPPPFFNVLPLIPQQKRLQLRRSTDMDGVVRIEISSDDTSSEENQTSYHTERDTHVRREKPGEEAKDYISLDVHSDLDHPLRSTYYPERTLDLQTQSTQDLLTQSPSNNAQAQAFRALIRPRAPVISVPLTTVYGSDAVVGNEHDELQNNSGNQQAPFIGPLLDPVLMSRRIKHDLKEALRAQRWMRNVPAYGITKARPATKSRGRRIPPSRQCRNNSPGLANSDHEQAHSSGFGNSVVSNLLADVSDNIPIANGPRSRANAVNRLPSVMQSSTDINVNTNTAAETNTSNVPGSSDKYLRQIIRGHKADIDFLKSLLHAKGVDQVAIDEINARITGGQTMLQATECVLGDIDRDLLENANENKFGRISKRDSQME